MGKIKRPDGASAAVEDIDAGLDGALVFVGALVYHDVAFLGCFHVGGADAQTPMTERVAPFEFDDSAFFFEVAEIQVLWVELADYFGKMFGEFLDFIIALAGKVGVQRHDPLANRRYVHILMNPLFISPQEFDCSGFSWKYIDGQEQRDKEGDKGEQQFCP